MMITIKQKKELPPGPWMDEPDHREWIDSLTGLPCVIRRRPAGHLCGYVLVPRGSSLDGKSYDEVDVAVHGGLTYSADHIMEYTHPGWVFGFDCAHSNDILPSIYNAPPGFYRTSETYKDFAYVENECRSLAAQLKDILDRSYR